VNPTPPRTESGPDTAKTDEIVVAAMGPLGHVYLPDRLRAADLAPYCARLVREAHVPLVIAPGPDGTARAWNARGEYRLPEDIPVVVGKSHPFLDEVGPDLMRLCAHPDSGDVLISGWDPEARPVSFPSENGAHAGPGTEETRGFVILPPSTPAADPDRGYIRPEELRALALETLGRSYSRRFNRHTKARADHVVRVMTYNVHSCIGMDGKLSIDRIARVIAFYDPDIICLQELDVGRARTKGLHQAEEIAAQVRMESHFHPAFEIEGERYGDAILCSFPMHLVKTGALPTYPHRRKDRSREPRGAMWVEVEFRGAKLQIFNTHLGLNIKEREAQARALVSDEWLGAVNGSGPVMMCGDFNAFPRSRVCKSLRCRLRDAQLEGSRRPQRTWPGRLPLGRIDHVFVSEEFEIGSIMVPRTALTRLASDHLPLIVDLKLRR
jgi:endonuclease/exonuclease/phosphatase family metal-dependent hydrolase